MTTYRINRSVIVTASRTGRLDLHGLSLDAVPIELFDNPLLVENLTFLDLSSNRLSSLPAELIKMSKLKELLLDDNRFAALPLELCELPALKAIALENNPLPQQLMSLYLKSRPVNTSSGRAREVSAVLQWLLHHEDSAKLAESVPSTPTVPSTSVSATSSAVSSPASSRPSSADSDSSAASRSKQASLTSDLFGTKAATLPSEHKFSRKQHPGSHPASNVFSCASQPYDGHTGKKVHPSSEGNAMSAPFGTDHQPVESVKPRRLAREDSEKENELSNTVKNAPFAHSGDTTKDVHFIKSGKRINRDQAQAQSPFATLPSVPTNFQSESAAASAHLPQPSSSSSTPRATPPATPSAQKKSTDSEGMSAALSHLSLDSSLPTQRKGIKIVDRGSSDIFGQAEPVTSTSRVQGKRHPSVESVDKDSAFDGGKFVQRGGRARVNHGQKDSQLW